MEGNPQCYQLYLPTVGDLTKSYLQPAHNNGFDVSVMTLDTWDLAWRPIDLETGLRL